MSEFSKKEERAIFDLLVMKGCRRECASHEAVGSLRGEVIQFLTRFDFNGYAFQLTGECLGRLEPSLKKRLKEQWGFLVKRGFVRECKGGLFGYTGKLLSYKFKHMEKPWWLISSLKKKVKIPTRTKHPRGYIPGGPEA